MPMYEYLCEANGRSVEVVHRMSERYETWGELCEKSQIDPGDTPPESPVRRLIGGGTVNNTGNTLTKIQEKHGERSKQLKHGPMAAPPRSGKW